MTTINIQITNDAATFEAAGLSASKALALAHTAAIGRALEAEKTIKVAEAARRFVLTLRRVQWSFDTEQSAHERWIIGCSHHEAKRALIKAVEDER
jgi:hypothetical protein